MLSISLFLAQESVVELELLMLFFIILLSLNWNYPFLKAFSKSERAGWSWKGPKRWMTELLWTDLAEFDFSDLSLTSRFKGRSFGAIYVSYMQCFTEVLFYYNGDARACLLCHVKLTTRVKSLLFTPSFFWAFLSLLFHTPFLWQEGKKQKKKKKKELMALYVLANE